MKLKSNTKEAEAIKKAIVDYYHEGHVNSDSSLYEEIFLDEWKFFTHDEHGQLRVIDKNEYYSWHDPNKVDKSLNWKTEIEYIDVTNKIGSVKIMIGNQNVQFTDYFNMMKIDDRWWIVHKISTRD